MYVTFFEAGQQKNLYQAVTGQGTSRPLYARAEAASPRCATARRWLSIKKAPLPDGNGALRSQRPGRSQGVINGD